MFGTKAVFYHFTHAIVLVFLAFSAQPTAAPAGCSVLAFSLLAEVCGIMALTNIRWLEAIITAGRICFLAAGWAWLFSHRAWGRDGQLLRPERRE